MSFILMYDSMPSCLCIHMVMDREVHPEAPYEQ